MGGNMVRCVKVKRENAEAVHKKLAAEGALDHSHIPKRDGEYVYFPLAKGVKTKLPTVQKKLLKRTEQGKPLSAELAGKLTLREREELVKSFDIVGDIAVVEIPPALLEKEALVAGAIMKNHHNVKVVAKKTGGTSGEFRIRPVRVIAGENRTRTIYREGGCDFELDLNKTYFSSRLGTERTRLAQLVGKNERVLVPFAGVGPFAIRIAKKAKEGEVVGVELNPDAARFFEGNARRNGCRNVAVVCGDVGRFLPGKYAGWADRIAMPLPKDASGFLANAIPCLKKGGVLHYYAFGDSKNPCEEAERQVVEAAAKLGRKAKLIFRRTVRPYSKTIVQVVVDFQLF